MKRVLIVALAGLLLAGCQAQQQQADATAATSTLTSLKPLLDEVAKNHPEQAAAVTRLEANWATNERADYNAAVPLLTIEKADRPDLATSIDDKLYTWNMRLTAAGQ